MSKHYNIDQKIKFPFVIKCRYSVSSSNVMVVNSFKDIDNIIYSLNCKNCDQHLIVKYIEGNIKYATHILAAEGKILMIKTIEHRIDYRDIYLHQGINAKSAEVDTMSVTDQIYQYSSKMFHVYTN